MGVALPRKMMWVLAVIALLVGCAAGPPSAEMAAAPEEVGDRVRLAEAHGVDDIRAEASPAQASGSSVSSPTAEPPETEAKSERGQLLIYTGSLVLAIYEVDETQERIVDAVEEMGGYVSERSSSQLTVRVPAELFRDAMAALSKMGDVLDTSWRAQDVTEEVRDLEIRLRNARQLRDRLEGLLEEAETVADALEIERELERVTLEIERILGQLASFEDRIAYSTIEISFRPIEIDEVPREDFMLPFTFFDQLGLESLMRVPRRYR